MHSIKSEHGHESINERRQSAEESFVCISECDLYDQVCTTRCVLTSGAWAVIKKRLTRDVVI